MSSLAMLVNPPTPIIRPGRPGGLGWARNEAMVRSDGAHSKGELAKRILGGLTDGPISCLNLARKLDANRDSVNKSLSWLMEKNQVVRSGQRRGYTYSLAERCD